MRTLMGLILLSGAQVWGQTHSNLVERSLEVTIEEKNPNLARKALLEKATEKVSEDLIKEIIGEQKFQRNKALIQSKILRSSIRYVPFSKPGNLVPTEKGFKLAVDLKVNQADLQKVLLENGLLYESDMAPLLLPVILFDDQVQSRDWAWWQDADVKKNDLMKLSRYFETQMKAAFLKSNFYLIRPQALHYNELLPKQAGSPLLSLFQGRQIDFQTWQKLTQPWNVQILLQGHVQIQKSQRAGGYKLAFKLAAIQMQNAREIAEVIRSYETDSGQQEIVVEKKLREVAEVIAQELASQVFDAWQKGTIGSSLFRLTIKGKVPMLLQENMKEYIKNQIREVKDIKERVISSDQLSLEIDSSVTPREISQKNPKLQLAGYVLLLESANEQEIFYKLVKEGAK